MQFTGKGDRWSEQKDPMEVELVNGLLQSDV
jgi:hypothetical protein